MQKGREDGTEDLKYSDLEYSFLTGFAICQDGVCNKLTPEARRMVMLLPVREA